MRNEITNHIDKRLTGLSDHSLDSIGEYAAQRRFEAELNEAHDSLDFWHDVAAQAAAEIDRRRAEIRQLNDSFYGKAEIIDELAP